MGDLEQQQYCKDSHTAVPPAAALVPCILFSSQYFLPFLQSTHTEMPKNQEAAAETQPGTRHRPKPKEAGLRWLHQLHLEKELAQPMKRATRQGRPCTQWVTDSNLLRMDPQAKDVSAV